jgi:hypothetical protein
MNQSIEELMNRKSGRPCKFGDTPMCLLEDFRELKKNYNKEYYQNNKYILKQKALKQITCDCGKTVGWSYLKKHQKTNKCIFIREQLQYISDSDEEPEEQPTEEHTEEN